MLYSTWNAEKLYSVIISIRLITLFVAMPIGFTAFGITGGVSLGIALSYFSYLPDVDIFCQTILTL